MPGGKRSEVRAAHGNAYDDDFSTVVCRNSRFNGRLRPIEVAVGSRPRIWTKSPVIWQANDISSAHERRIDALERVHPIFPREVDRAAKALVYRHVYATHFWTICAAPFVVDELQIRAKAREVPEDRHIRRRRPD